jgi:hypothetical protein
MFSLSCCGMRHAPQIFREFYGVDVSYYPYPDTISMCALG